MTEREKWVLGWLADQRFAVSAIPYFDDGAAFLGDYADAFGLNGRSDQIVQRSLNRVLRALRDRGLVASHDGVNTGWNSVRFDGPPTHCNTWRITSRGERRLLHSS